MKTVFKITIALLMLFSTKFVAQDFDAWRKMKPEQRKEYINKLSPEERKSLLKKFNERMIVDDLNVPQENEEEFRRLFDEYQESQKSIRERFRPSEDYENMTDEQAKIELENSFNVGQQLLENRRRYAEKFQKIMRPQQVLQLFQNEGIMRNRMFDRRNDSRTQPQQPSMRQREYQNEPRQFRERSSTDSPFRNMRNNNGGFRNTRTPQ